MEARKPFALRVLKVFEFSLHAVFFFFFFCLFHLALTQLSSLNVMKKEMSY